MTSPKFGLFIDEDGDEAPTSKIQFIACPRCEGKKEILVQIWPIDASFNGRAYGEYQFQSCPDCLGCGKMTVAHARKIMEEKALRKAQGDPD